MATPASILHRTTWVIGGLVAIYAVALAALTRPWLQRSVLYAHKINTVWWHDLNKPEQFGFAKNQITPFNFSTPDNKLLYAWHIMPLGLYSKHEVEIIRQPSGCAEDIAKTKAFDLLANDPEARLIISFHGNAGSVSQGWRPDIYRSLSDGSTSTIHILAVDYRGFGLSSGFPTEEGLIIDGIATVNWALNVAKIPSDRIVIIGHSLGTAITAATVEHFAREEISFAGVILIAGFSDLPNLLTSYSVAGVIPLLSPLGWLPFVQNRFKDHIIDAWPSAKRISNFVRWSKKVRLFIIHARNDYEIPWRHSDALFAAATNAQIPGMVPEVFAKIKERGTVNMGDGAFISTWKAEPGKIIQEIIVAFGGHNRVMTFAPVALAALKAFGLDDGELLFE